MPDHLVSGTFEALEYYLDKERSVSSVCINASLEPKDRVNFTIPSTTEQHAGRYRCYYMTHAGRSKRSDPLEVVVTGFYTKPNLSLLSNPVETSGRNLTIQCFSWLGFDRFILTEEGEHKVYRTLHVQLVPFGQVEAVFQLDLRENTQGWTFRCYGNYRVNPYMWSEPSDPLKLLVSDLHSQDYAVENLVRMAVAALVLVALGILLFEAWHSQTRTQDAAKR